MKNKKFLIIGLITLVGVGVFTGTYFATTNKLNNNPKIEQQVKPIQDDRIDPNKEQEVFKYAKNTLVFKAEGDVFLYDTESGELKDVRNMVSILKKDIKQPNFKKMDVLGTRIIFKEINSNQLVLLEVNDNTVSVKQIDLELREEAKINFACLDDSYIYAVQGQTVYTINYLNQEKVVKTTLRRVPETFIVFENTYIYSNEDKLLKEGKDGGDLIEITIGDKSRQTILKDGSIYLMNAFGEGNRSSVLMKINPTNMKVEQISEVSGTTAKMLGFNEDGSEVMVQVNNMVNSYGTENLKVDNDRKIQAEQGAQQFGEAIYALEEGKVKIISVVDGSLIKEFEVEEGQLVLTSPIIVVNEQPISDVDIPIVSDIKEGGDN